jgi:hypothetical protein
MLADGSHFLKRALAEGVEIFPPRDRAPVP